MNSPCRRIWSSESVRTVRKIKRVLLVVCEVLMWFTAFMKRGNWKLCLNPTTNPEKMIYCGESNSLSSNSCRCSSLLRVRAKTTGISETKLVDQGVQVTYRVLDVGGQRYVVQLPSFGLVFAESGCADPKDENGGAVSRMSRVSSSWSHCQITMRVSLKILVSGGRVTIYCLWIVADLSRFERDDGGDHPVGVYRKFAMRVLNVTLCITLTRHQGSSRPALYVVVLHSPSRMLLTGFRFSS